MRILQIIRKSGSAGILLWVWPLFSLVISRKREVEDYSIIDRSALLQIGFILACLVLTFFEVRKKRINLLRYCWMRPIRWIFLYLLLCGLSTLWSISPTYTAWMVIEAFVFLFLILLVLANIKNKPKFAVNWIVLWAVYCGLLYAARAFKSGHVIEDVFSLHGLGIDVYAPIVLLSIFIVRKKLLYSFIIFLCIVSTATKAYVALLLGILTYSIMSKSLKWQSVAMFGVLGILLCFLYWGGGDSISILFPGKTQHSIETGTGRTVAWQILIESGLETPWLGKGFVVAERAATENAATRIYISHNSVIAAFVGTGIIGAMLVIMFFVDMVLLSYRSIRPVVWRPVFVASSFMMLFIAMVVNTIGSRLSGSWVVMVFMAGIIAILAKK